MKHEDKKEVVPKRVGITISFETFTMLRSYNTYNKSCFVKANPGKGEDIYCTGTSVQTNINIGGSANRFMTHPREGPVPCSGSPLIKACLHGKF